MGAQLRAIAGVGEVQLVRDARIEIQGKPTMLVAADIARPAKARHASARGRQYRGHVPAGRRQGKAMLASENFALLRGLKLGDVVDIPSPGGSAAPCRSPAS